MKYTIRQVMAENGSGDSRGRVEAPIHPLDDFGEQMNWSGSSDEWLNEMAQIILSVRGGVEQVIHPRSKERFRVMVLLDQIECQVKFGEFYTTKDVERMIQELNHVVCALDVPRNQQQSLVNAIGRMSAFYFKCPKSEPATVPHFVLFGETGVGKSTIGNIFLGKTSFKTSASGRICTTDIECSSGKWLDKHKEVVVIDTPGLNDTQMEDFNYVQDLQDTLRKLQYVSAFILVFNSGQTRITNTDCNMIKVLRASFGTDFFLNTCVIFTNWSASAAAKERRRYCGTGEKETSEKVNRLLREQFEFDFDLPCFFVDSIEFQNDMNAEAHLASLDKFYNTVSNLLPYHTLEISDMEKNMQEMQQMLSRQYKDIQAFREQVTDPVRIEEIDIVLCDIQEMQDAERSKELQMRSEIRGRQANSRNVPGLDEAINKVQSFKSISRKWGMVAKTLTSICEFSYLVENVVPYGQTHYFRNGRLIVKQCVFVGDILFKYLKKQYE